MDLQMMEELKALVEALATSGKPTLKGEKIKRLKSICKREDDALKFTFEQVMTYLSENHAEVRFSCVQICDQLFMRSHVFRTLLLNQFDQYMVLTMGTEKKRSPLPQPSENLRELSLRNFKVWHDNFGEAYTKLKQAQEYLTAVKKVNFRKVMASYNRNNPVCGNIKEIRNKLRADIRTGVKDIEEHNAEMKRLYDLLTSEMLFTASDFEQTSNDRSSFEPDELRELGLPAYGYSVELDLREMRKFEVRKTEDNACILDTLNEAVKVCKKKWIPKLDSWLTDAEKYDAPAAVMDKLRDIATSMKNHLDRFEMMDVLVEDSDDDDDLTDFIEVKEVDYINPDIPSCSKTSLAASNSSQTDTNKTKNHTTNDAKKSKTKSEVPHSKLAENSSKPLRPIKNSSITMDSGADSKTKNAEKPGAKRKMREKEKPPKKVKSLREAAPVVSFGNDLLYWDKEKMDDYKKTVSFGAAKDFDVDHRFLNCNSAASTDEGMSDAAFSQLTARKMEFAGVFKPITHRCGARLPSGKLCPRQDRYKCPFHGKIVPRDDNGEPLDGTEEVKKEKKVEAPKDVDHLMDVEKLSDGTYKLVPKKMKETESYQEASSSRSRLKKRILSKKALKNTIVAMNALDERMRIAKLNRRR